MSDGVPKIQDFAKTLFGGVLFYDLTFDFNGTPRFGADIFNMQKKYPKRIIFEYSANCSMSLKYNNKKDSIVFDHLSPTSPQLEGQYQYYCNDMSYDGFGFRKGKWNYGMDLNAINDKDEKALKDNLQELKEGIISEASRKIVERKEQLRLGTLEESLQYDYDVD